MTHLPLRTLLSITIIFVVLPQGVSTDQRSSEKGAAEKSLRRPLRVALYPYVPQKAEMYWRLEQEFEDKFQEVDLRFVDLGTDYYGKQLVKALTDGKVDVVEVDTVFLRDLVDKKLIVELSGAALESEGTFLPVAEKAARVDDKTYGAPHWVCGNFMFFRADDPERSRLHKAHSLNALERVIGRPVDAGQAVLIDLKGKTTLGEKYLDALLDICQDEEQLKQRLSPSEPDPEAVRALNRAFSLCPGGICDSEKHHRYGGFYPKQFAHRRARILIGYSERLFFVVDEYLNGVREDEAAVGAIDFQFPNNGPMVVSGKPDIEVEPAPLGDPSKEGTVTLAWVDVLSVSTSCPPEVRHDADSLIAFFNDKSFTKRLLIPEYGQAPRYLLPARTSLYADGDILAAAPLYARFIEIMKNSLSMTTAGLNDKLRAVGEAIDNRGLSIERP